MKILELTLVNFLPILSGMNKESITLDLRNSKELINVFIGKIGSGKTYVLSHLQPFSTVGTLDVRNVDDPIVEGKDGLKKIVYLKDQHEYVITHEYLWSGNKHTKKSYIEKDGIELNGNGNSSSFKELIQIEFGIDQSYLRLLRLGPNVINFINMKATERKSFIASLLTSTDVYLRLYKEWSQELRVLSTSASILSNKLSSYNVSSVDEIHDKIECVNDEISDLTTKIEELNKQKYQLQAENKTLIGVNSSYKDFLKRKSELNNLIIEIKKDISYLSETMKLYEEYPDINEVSKSIGNLDGKISSIDNTMVELNKTYDKYSSELHSLIERKAISIDENHIKTLKETYDELINQSDQYSRDLKYFKCEYSSTFLTGFIGDLNLMNVIINELMQYDSQTIDSIYNSDTSILVYAKKQIEILGYRKLKVQKMINNLKFSETYSPPGKLYLPPFCPTKSCPYYKTHPVTIQKEYSKVDEMKEQILSLQNELKELDIEIYKYSDYSLIYSKISTLKEYWKKAKPILSSLNALNYNNLNSIITNTSYQVWYNYDKIIDTIELLEKREKYFELTEKIKLIKTEINELSLNDYETLNKDIERLTSNVNEIALKIETNEKKKISLENELKTYNKIYVDLSEKSIKEDELNSKSSLLNQYVEDLSNMQIHHQQIEDNNARIQSLDTSIVELTTKFNNKTSEKDSMQTKINDIEYTNKELSKILKEYEYMSHLVNATSSKKGIPLVLIQMFLDSCRDTVNEMVYAVCEDEFEILPFDINESEFKIPYMINGKKIDDISKASQGQSSIVSTCLSFALVKQVGSIDYNIPLLDEMDAPLHKNDKQKFISVLLKYLEEIQSEQCFVISHDENTFDGYPVQVIMTTDELVNKERYKNVIRL